MAKEKPQNQCSVLLNEISSNPLFSILSTSFLLILIYFPALLPLLFSPVILSTLLLLSTLLRFGSHHTTDPIRSEPETHIENRRKITSCASFDDGQTELHPKIEFFESLADTQMGFHPEIEFFESLAETQMGFHQKIESFESFVEWGQRGGALEVIYEEYEGEGEEDENSPEFSRSPPEYSPKLGYFGFGCTDSDTDSDDDSAAAEAMAAEWWEEEGEGMIEIALEEDNLIEIDISGCR